MGRSQTVIVTGANSGLGLATALQAAAAGFDVVGTVRSEAKADLLSDAADTAGIHITPHLLDVTDAAGCEALVERHRPWAIVNNAGFGTIGAVEDVDDDEARLILETMVVAPIRLARLAIPHQRESGGGRIINVSSIYGFTSTALSGWYQGAKHALEGITDALRMEVASDSIAVVLIQPGAIDTHIWAETEQAVKTRSGSRYEESYQRSRRVTDLLQRGMISSEGAARTVVRALTANRPRSRYLIGRDAWLIAASDRLTLTQISDRLTRQVLHL